MRVVLTIHHELDANSGAPGSTIALAEAYQRAGHETAILSFDDLPARLGAQQRMLAFPLLVASRLGGALGRWCDVVDASSGDAWLWSVRRRAAAALLVTRSHGLEHREHLERLADEREGLLALRRRYRLYHGGERLHEVALSFRRADLALFLNRDDLDYAVANLGVPSGRAHLVRYGLDESFLGLPAPRPGTPRIAVIARHTPGMGKTYIVPALEQLLDRHRDLGVTLLGTGACEADVRSGFSPTGRDRIHVVPGYRREELPRLLAGHEIAMSAKTSEGFGKALLEAMACGLVPVAAAASGPARIIEHGRSGLLVPPRDAAALVEAVERLLVDPDLRLRLRANAHGQAQRWPASDAQTERLALVESALANRRASLRGRDGAAGGQRAGLPAGARPRADA